MEMQTDRIQLDALKQRQEWELQAHPLEDPSSG